MLSGCLFGVSDGLSGCFCRPSEMGVSSVSLPCPAGEGSVWGWRFCGNAFLLRRAWQKFLLPRRPHPSPPHKRERGRVAVDFTVSGCFQTACLCFGCIETRVIRFQAALAVRCVGGFAFGDFFFVFVADGQEHGFGEVQVALFLAVVFEDVGFHNRIGRAGFFAEAAEDALG